MKILITGASGLLGFQVTEVLKKNHEIIALTHNNIEKIDKSITFFYADLSSDFETQSFPKQIDVVIHLAQSLNYRNFPEKANDVFQVNCAATARLLDYARQAQVKHFIYTSTGSVYAPYHGTMNEDTFTLPTSFYANSKLIGEALARSYEPYFKICILRLFFLYGPHPTTKQTLVNSLIQRIKQDEVIHIDGLTEGMVFTPTSTLDVAECINQIISSEVDGLYNFANPEPRSLLNVANNISELLHKKILFTHHSEKTAATIVPPIDKIKSIIPNLSFIPFSEGIKKLL